MEIIKADGTREAFKPEKLSTSLRRAGAHPSEIKHIQKEVSASLRDGMTTQEIYRLAFKLLRESGDPVAAKYSLRRAVFGLGPTGFPFEDYLGKIFEAEGYTTAKRVTMKGKCATHEIDLAAYRKTDSFIAEAKFHSRLGVKSDLQVALYSYARYLDLKTVPICKEDECGVTSLRLITNTKFTRSAEKYAECVGIDLLSWSYPRKGNLQDLIEQTGLYPVTVLTGISNAQKRALLQQGIILCVDLMRKPNILHSLNLSKKKSDAVLTEISGLCGSK